MKYIEMLRQTEKELETSQIEVKVEQAQLELQGQILSVKQSLISKRNEMKKEMMKQLNFVNLVCLQDDISLLERRLEQFKKLSEELF